MAQQNNNPTSRHLEVDRRLAGGAAVLVVLVVLAYWPTSFSEFVGLDDYQYVVDNQLVRNPSWTSVERFFGEVRNPSTVAGYYQPLTMVSLMLDAWLAGGDGLDPFIYHLTNILLHAVTAVLVMLLVRAAVGGIAVPFVVALLWAVHPMQVESVAWISQRKTVLSTPLAVGCLLCYLEYGRLRRVGEDRRVSWLVASVLLYVASGLAKPTVMLLPVTLPLLDIFPLGRIAASRPTPQAGGSARRWAPVLEKLPYLVCMLGLMWISWVSQATSQAQLMAPNLGSLDLLSRMAMLICYNFMLYAGNVVWPAMLSPYRDLPSDLSLAYWPVLLSVIGTAAIACACLTAYRWSKPLFVGGVAFGILLAPALGAVRFVETCVADRFLYLPSVFLLLPLAALLAGVGRLRPSRRQLVYGGAGVVAVALAAVMRSQQNVWHDSHAMWGRVVRIAPHFSRGLANFAAEEGVRGNFQSSIGYAERALAIAKDDPQALHALGRALARTGQPERAVAVIRQAIAGGLGPTEPMAHVSLAEALLLSGDLAGARAECERAIAMGRGATSTYAMLGATALEYGKNGSAAAEYYRLAVDSRPDNATLRWNLGAALESCGQNAAALVEYERAIAICRQQHLGTAEMDKAANALRSRMQQSTTAPGASQTP